jgi:protein Tob/BTG
MRTEITNAVNFLSNMIRIKNPTSDKLEIFREALARRFVASFTDHWFPERPLRGNGYRCVRIVNNRMDRLVAAAGADAGLTEEYLVSAFPQELSVWIDPYEVSYRIGEDGSVGIIYSLTDNINENDSGKGSSDDELDCCSLGSETCRQSSSSSPTSSICSLSSSSRQDSFSSFRVSPDTVNHAYLLGSCDG